MVAEIYQNIDKINIDMDKPAHHQPKDNNSIPINKLSKL